MNEWIEINLPFGPIWDPDTVCTEKDSFCKLGLNKPGTIIKVKGGKNYLLGDINCIGGVCDDCVAFGKEMIVKRYMVLDLPS